MAHVLLLLVSLLFWAVTKEFAESLYLNQKHFAFTLKAQNGISAASTNEPQVGGKFWFQIKTEFKAILHLTRMLNSLMGGQHALWMIGNVFYYSAAFARENVWISFREDIFYLSMPVTSVLLAASGTYQVSLSYNLSQLSH